MLYVIIQNSENSHYVIKVKLFFFTLNFCNNKGVQTFFCLTSVFYVPNISRAWGPGSLKLPYSFLAYLEFYNQRQ